MKFIWDAANAAKHLAKHGVSFEEAETVFADPDVYPEPSLRHPGRTNYIGYSDQHRCLYVVTVEVISDEVSKIISAWPATKAQKRRYESQ